MAKIYYLARTPTIADIVQAIEKAGDSGLPTIKIPEGSDWCFIYHDTLKAIADYIRAKEGTDALIPVLELVERLLALGSQSGGGSTTAILGRAILGKAILGNASSLPKLNAPTIRLEMSNGKLSAPVIRLYEDAGEIIKLATPVIRLCDEGNDDSGDGSTTAILGKAILGKAILGSTSSLSKLDAPVIRLVDMGEIIKLDAPVIRLEQMAEVIKLDSPSIRLEVIEDVVPDEPDVPVIEKLDAPIIRIEAVMPDVPDEPDIPDVPQLDAPIIRIEVIAPDVPDEPDEPDVPDVQKLDAPTIRIEVVTPDMPKLDAPIIYLYEKMEIAAPVISLNGSVVSWDAVKNATSYLVYVDGQQVTRTEATSIDFAGFEYGMHTITVAATNGEITSGQSNSVLYINELKLDAPVLSLTGEILRWTEVSNASLYRLYVNGAYRGSYFDNDSTIASVLLDYDSGVEYTITVTAQNGDVESKHSNPVYVTKNW